MTTFDDEVDPFEAGEKTPSPYLDEDVDDFDESSAEDLDDDEDDDDLDDDEDEDDLDEDEDDLDEDDGDDEDDDDDLDDDLDDATEEEIDLVVALYREDSQAVALPMASDLANDLDEFMTQLRRIPGDAGAVGMVSIAGEFFVLCRVRGRTVQVLLSDAVAANDWPIARDVADYLGEDIPDPDDDSEAMGDLGILADQGVSEFDMEAIAENLDEDSDELLRQIANKMKFLPQFDRAIKGQR
ncbi:MULTISPECIES: tRNA adenosine deaminase-associated protein [unclassified Luteococcus]|uniref:tRNA adenosine deaminase-associated protein n=1 Tax=unclassified Luteococcus TaxID=2639923 RepID=UPI00313D0293